MKNNDHTPYPLPREGRGYYWDIKNNKFLIQIFKEKESNHISSQRAMIYTGLTNGSSATLFNEASLSHIELDPLVIWPKI